MPNMTLGSLARVALALGLSLALGACGDDDYGIDGNSLPHDLSVNQDLTQNLGDGGTLADLSHTD